MTERQPNIVLIVADELMAAALSCYGGTQIDTPGLDRLSAEGVTFETAYCNAPVCTPSRYSMLTGRYPWGMRVYHNQSPTPGHVESIAGMLARRGYDTVAIGKMHFKGAEQLWGYRSRPYGDFGGLSHQPDPLSTAPRLSFVADAGPADIPEEQLHDSIVGRMAGEYLDTREPDRPFLLHLGFNFPHYPLRPPKRLFDRYFPGRADLPRIGSAPVPEHPWMRERRAVYRDLLGEGAFTEEQIRRARAAYYGCVAMLDEQLVRIFGALDRRGLTEQTVIVFTADHGELLGEYGTWEKNCFYEPSARVPLLMRIPGAGPGRRVPDIVELVDLLPTLRQLVDRVPEEGAPDVDGQSLLPLLGWPGHRDKDYAVSELAPTYVDGLARMVRLDRWKYVAYDTHPPSLFDLRADPDELDDLGLVADPPRPEPRLVELARTDFDRVRRESEAAELAVHPGYADMTPNQYHLDGRSLVDAEDFYVIDSWVPASGSTAVRRVRPRSDPGSAGTTTAADRGGNTR